MITEQQLKGLDIYTAGLALYKSRKWKEAIARFKEALKVDPHDGPSQLYLERCEQYLEHPPEDDWDGVFVMKTK